MNILERAFQNLRSAGPVAAREGDYEAWLQHYYPKAVRKPMAYYHREFWDWLWQVKTDEPHPEYDAFFGIWTRRGGKTTSGQLAIAVVGAKKLRRYCWLLSRTQAQANQKLLTVRQAIGRMGSAYLADYPHMAKARTEDGYNLGWSTQRLICGDDDDLFVVEAIGLDMAVRGANVEFVRPDFIMPDDLDNLHDSHYVTEKNIETLTKSILLAGSSGKIVLGFQNLIHADSIVSQIYDGRAQFLTNRFVSYAPAVEGDFKYELQDTPKGRRWVILSGTPTWPEGFGLAECEKELNDVGPDAFESECQHNVNAVHEDATFKEFNPVYHCITVSEFMRYMFGNGALGPDMRPLPHNFTGAMANGLFLPRGDCAMCQDWGNNRKHPVGLRWLWKPGEYVPLTDSVFFIREACWPTFPVKRDDPREHPSYGQVYKFILEVERSLGMLSFSTHGEGLNVVYRLNSHERPEAAASYRKDFGRPLVFRQIDTKEAKEGILHLQELQHVNYDEFHPFRIDPRTLESVPKHQCTICKWKHNGEHLRGRPRAFYVVADGQGELFIDDHGRLAVKPALDEMGQARTRWEYPKHKPRETAAGEEKDAPKINDEMVDTDRALTGRVFGMIKPLPEEQRMAFLIEKAMPAHLRQDAIANVEDPELQSALLQGRYQRAAMERWRIEQEDLRNNTAGLSIYELSRMMPR